MPGARAARIHRQPTLASQVRTALSEDIAAGALAPGQRILIERLAERLGVSPTPVREAIACWVEDGLIRKSADGRLQVVPLTRAYVVDVFLVRRALEGLAAELAASRLSDDELALLRASLAETTRGLEHGDFGPYVATDALLHGLVATAAGSPMLARELEVLQTHIAYVRGYAQRQAGDHMQLSHGEHERLLAALAGRDPAAARATMEQHIHQSGERIARLMAFDEQRVPSIGSGDGAARLEGATHEPG
jgi:DNA-binding GntR family transcriptional regulator